MAKKFQNKYRIGPARAQWWDYGWNGAYFITICTKNREHFFGQIQNGKMELSNVGVIVDILWHEIPNHAKYVELGAFVVMPNHIHGILKIEKPYSDVDSGHALNLRRNTSNTDSDPHKTDPTNNRTIGQKRFQNIGKNTVSSIIGSYKSAVTKHANRLGLENGWQSRFHDRIVRDSEEFQRISNYIIANPENWEEDKLNSGI